MLYVKAAVVAGAKKEKIIQKSKDHFEIFVKEKAKNNLANKKVIELLALFFDISSKKIRIINGHQHPHKLLVIDIEI